MKKEIIYPIILIPAVMFIIIGVLTYLNVFSGIWLIVVWIIGFLIASVVITYIVAQEKIRALNEEDKKRNDE